MSDKLAITTAALDFLNSNETGATFLLECLRSKERGNLKRNGTTNGWSPKEGDDTKSVAMSLAKHLLETRKHKAFNYMRENNAPNEMVSEGIIVVSNRYALAKLKDSIYGTNEFNQGNFYSDVQKFVGTEAKYQTNIASNEVKSYTDFVDTCKKERLNNAELYEKDPTEAELSNIILYEKEAKSSRSIASIIEKPFEGQKIEKEFNTIALSNLTGIKFNQDEINKTASIAEERLEPYRKELKILDIKYNAEKAYMDKIIEKITPEEKEKSLERRMDKFASHLNKLGDKKFADDVTKAKEILTDKGDNPLSIKNLSDYIYNSRN